MFFSEGSDHMNRAPRQEKKGHFWHAQGFRTHVVPMQILVSVVQGLAAGCPPLKKFDGVEIVFLQGDHLSSEHLGYVHLELPVTLN